MPETAIENKICQKCGAEVRANTLFCYNCGAAVAPIDNGGNNLPTVKDKLIEEEKSAAKFPDKNSTGAQESKMRSAASLQKSKSAAKKNVEVVWEEPESAPNIWFLAVAFIVTLFAAGIIAAMLYIR